MSDGVDFLKRFHSKNPGATALALGKAVDSKGVSSYDRLASLSLGLSESSKILDLACGDGFLLERISILRRDGIGLYGVDFSSRELELAVDRGIEGAELLQMDVLELNFPSNFFDVVLCHMSFMLFEDPKRVADIVFNILRPGGVFGVILGDGGSPEGARKVFVKLIKEAVGKLGGTCPELGSRVVRSVEGLRAVMAGLGFLEAKIEGFQLQIFGSDEENFDNLKLMYNFEALTDEGKVFVERAFGDEIRLSKVKDYKMSLIEAVFQKPPYTE